MFLICGEALFDLFSGHASASGQVAIDARPGGSPYNVAIGLARLQHQATLFTGVSTDAFGAILADILSRENVQCDRLIRSDRRTTLSVVGVDAAGQPDYAFYGAQSADCSISIADLPLLDDHITGLHFGSYSIVVPPVADAFAALAKREARRFISLDPNIRPTIEPDMNLWNKRIEKLLPITNMVKISDEDIAMLFGERSVENLAVDWLAKGPELVVITQGGGPARAFWQGGHVAVQPPDIEVVDTVGAGDTFQAMLLALVQEHLSQGRHLPDLNATEVSAWLNKAAVAAAITCARVGADLPSMAEVNQAL